MTPEPPVTVTEAAADRLKAALGGRLTADIVLRIVFHVRDEQPVHGVVPEHGARPDDAVSVQHGLTFVVSPVALPLVRGATIDYDPEGDAEEFLITNPNISVLDETADEPGIADADGQQRERGDAPRGSGRRAW